MPVALRSEETSVAEYPNKRGPPDAIEIALAENGEVDDMRTWCEHFACNPNSSGRRSKKLDR